MLDRPAAARTRGFTMMEVLAATAILAFVTAVITHAVSAGHVQTQDSRHQIRALFLAEALMDEIIRLPYADPDDGAVTRGPEAGESTRAAYDNADDYHGYPAQSSIETSSTILDLHGVAYPAVYQGFTRTVSCQYTTQTVSELGGAMDGLLITVNVQDPTGRMWTLTHFMMDDTEAE